VITINSVFLILFGIPAFFVERDLMRTLHRFRLQTSSGMSPNLDTEEPYLKGATEVFQADGRILVATFHLSALPIVPVLPTVRAAARAARRPGDAVAVVAVVAVVDEVRRVTLALRCRVCSLNRASVLIGPMRW